MTRSFRATCLLLAILAPSAAASVLEPPESAKQYAHSCRSEQGTIGVNYLRRSLPTSRGIQFVPGLLIVEVGVFPNEGEPILLPLSSFELRWKGRKESLKAVSASYAAASLKHPDWKWGREAKGVEIGAGTVNRRGEFEGVTLGGPPRAPRYPDDPRQRPQSDPPSTGSANIPQREPHPDELPERIIPLHALPGEPMAKPSAGYVYFAHDGKLKKMKNLQLTVRLPSERCEFALRRK